MSRKIRSAAVASITTSTIGASLLRTATRVFGTVAALAVLSVPAQAQWRVGAFLGGEHESSWDEFLVLGADARGAVGSSSVEFNPRFSYFIRDGLTRFQLDANLIKPLKLASNSRVEPFLGLGLAYEKVSYEADVAPSESNIGFNYIAGASIRTAGRIQPFAQFQYSVLNDAPNNAVISAGLHIKLGGSR